MHLCQVLHKDHTVEIERRQRWLGTANVPLDILRFTGISNEENIKRLVKLFSKDFRRNSPANRIPAIISEKQLQHALVLSNQAPGDLKREPSGNSGYPILSFPPGATLQCIRGLHRAEAAKRVLTGDHKHWTVDFFAADIDETFYTELAEEYSLEQLPDDGQIYQKIRKYQGCPGPRDAFLEQRWWAILEATSKSKKARLLQIFRNPSFKEEFDILLQVPALGRGLQLGSTHEMFAMWCPELSLNYLRCFKTLWFLGVCQGDTGIAERITPSDVATLERSVPGVCSDDKVRLEEMLQNGGLLAQLSPDERKAAWHSILSHTQYRAVVSFKTFFEDLKALQAPLSELKNIVDRGPAQTISSALSEAFQDVDKDRGLCKVLESDEEFAEVPCNKSQRIDIGIRQLWIFLIRQGKKKRNEENTVLLHRLASLARTLGFCSAKIKGLLEESLEDKIALDALLLARPSTVFVYDNPDLLKCRQKILAIFRTARRRFPEEQTTLDSAHGENTSSHERKQLETNFYLKTLHQQQTFESRNSFVQARSLYWAFFGPLELDLSTVVSRQRLPLTSLGYFDPPQGGEDTQEAAQDTSQPGLSLEKRIKLQYEGMLDQRVKDVRQELLHEFEDQKRVFRHQLENQYAMELNQRLEDETSRLTGKHESEMRKLQGSAKKVRPKLRSGSGITNRFGTPDGRLRKDWNQVAKENEVLKTAKDSTTLQTKIQDLESKLCQESYQYQQDKESQNTIINNLKSQLEQQQLQVKATEEQRRDATRGLQKDLTRIEEENKVLKKTEEDANTLQIRIQELESALQQGASQYQQVEESQATIISNLQSRLEQQQVQVQAAEREMSEVSKKAAEEVTRLQTKIQDLESRSQQEASHYQQDKASQTTTSSNLQLQLRDQEVQVNEVLTKAEEEESILQTKIQDLEARLQQEVLEHQQENESLRSELEQQQLQVEAKESEVFKKAAEEVTTLRTKIQGLESRSQQEASQYQRDKASQATDISNLQSQLENQQLQAEITKEEHLGTHAKNEKKIDKLVRMLKAVRKERDEYKRLLVEDGKGSEEPGSSLRDESTRLHEDRKALIREREETEQERALYVKLRNGEADRVMSEARSRDRAVQQARVWEGSKGANSTRIRSTSHREKGKELLPRENLGSSSLKNGRETILKSDCITFRFCESDNFTEQQVPLTEVQTQASKYYRNQQRSLYDSKGRELHPEKCLEDVTVDGTWTITVAPWGDLPPAESSKRRSPE